MSHDAPCLAASREKREQAAEVRRKCLRMLLFLVSATQRRRTWCGDAAWCWQKGPMMGRVGQPWLTHSGSWMSEQRVSVCVSTILSTCFCIGLEVGSSMRSRSSRPRSLLVRSFCEPPYNTLANWQDFPCFRSELYAHTWSAAHILANSLRLAPSLKVELLWNH